MKQETWLQQQLREAADPAYRAFMIRLLPTVAPQTVLGVRTPARSAGAKPWNNSAAERTWRATLQHTYFDATQ